MLKRAPRFLRVVEANGTWDALDQLDDQPELAEKIYAYERVGKPGMVHLNMGRKKHGGFYPMSAYRFLGCQPGDSEMRDKESWRSWCRCQQGTPSPKGPPSPQPLPEGEV